MTRGTIIKQVEKELGFGMNPLFGDAIGPWREWFAWYPVNTFDGVIVWGRTIYRRRYQSELHISGPISQWWGYAFGVDIDAGRCESGEAE